MTTEPIDLNISLPCTTYTDGAQSCLARIRLETPQEDVLACCDNCKAGYVISSLMAKIKMYEEKPDPLLQCTDCHNTESPAGAMARYFNHGRCMHCGGYFKVVRA